MTLTTPYLRVICHQMLGLDIARKLEYLGYHLFVCVILRLPILVQCRLVTDRQTDRHMTTANTTLV